MAQQRDYSDRLLIDEYLSKNKIELTEMERRNLEEACLPNFLHLGVVIQEADYITYFGGEKYKVKEKDRNRSKRICTYLFYCSYSGLICNAEVTADLKKFKTHCGKHFADNQRERELLEKVSHVYIY